MDIYHTPEIFVRRAAYKTRCWSEYLSMGSNDQNNSSLIANNSKEEWRKMDNNHDSTTATLNSDEQDYETFQNSRLKTSTLKLRITHEPSATRRTSKIHIETKLPPKVVQVKMINLSPKYSTEIIRLTPRSKTTNNLPDRTHKIQNRSSSVSARKDRQDNCTQTFVESLRQILPPKDDAPTLTKKQPLQGVSAILTQQKLSALVIPEKDPAACTKDSHIVKNLVMNRFLVNMKTEQCQYQQKSPLENPSNGPQLETSDQGESIKTMTHAGEIPETPFTEVGGFSPTATIGVENSPQNETLPLCNTFSLPRDLDVGQVKSANTGDYYDPQQFLKEALGDELFLSIDNNSSSGLSPKYNSSISTGDASGLLSETESRSAISMLPMTQGSLVETCQRNNSETDQKVLSLMHQAAEQHQHMRQSSKALTICRGFKKFAFSSEQVEAERLLLIAVLRNRAILHEINKIDLNNVGNSMQEGKISITNICVPLDERFYDPVQRRTSNLTHWFLCVALCNTQVYATTAVQASQNGCLIFEQTMAFSELSADFSLHVHIYCLEQRRSVRNFSEGSKYNINQEPKNSKCPSPKNIFKKHKPTHDTRSSNTNGIRTPSFLLVGTTKLDLKNISSQYPRQLENKHAYLKGIIYIDIKPELKVLVKHQGFLTIRFEAGGLPCWSRQWCLLDGSSLKYWNYPSDMDEKKPLGVIDLKKCVTAWITVVNTTFCARPRTLLLETTRPRTLDDSNSLLIECLPNSTLVRHLLSCDNERDVQDWAKHLNNVVSFLRNWNIT